MPEPTSTTAAALTSVGLTSAGLTIFGIATGIHPALLVCGFVGGWWSQSYEPAQPLLHRLSACVIPALVAAWGTPPVAAWATTQEWWPQTVASGLIQFPLALVLGLLANKVIGPAILRLAAKRAEGSA